jgi:hypothetical protein
MSTKIEDLNKDLEKLSYCCTCKNWIPNNKYEGTCSVIGTGVTYGLSTCGSFEVMSLESIDNTK